MSEKELVFELKQGSHRAFDAIYEKYSRRLYLYCFQYVKNAEETEEIVQDVFVKLWTSREKIKQEETLSSLLFIMSKNSVITAYRKNMRSPIYAEYVENQEFCSQERSDQWLEYSEFVKQLNTILETFPKTQRRVIELSRIQGLDNKSIAAQLCISEQTVKNLSSTGIKALRDQLKGFPTIFLALLLMN